MQFHVNYLHSGEYVWYTTHAHEQLNNLFRGMYAADVNSELDFLVANQQLDEEPRFFEEIRRHYFTIWPINVELHWVAIVLHVFPAPDSSPDSSPGKPRHVVNAVVADPERDPRTTGFVWSRLLRVLSPERGFRFPSAAPQPLWYPRQTDGYTCGLRAYEIMRVLLARINEAELRAAPEGRWEGVWADLGCDFQPDKVRAEMIGVVAVEALRGQGWGARLAVAPCEEVCDGHGGGPIPVRPAGAEGKLSHLPARAEVEYSPAVLALRSEALGLPKPSPAEGWVEVQMVLPQVPDVSAFVQYRETRRRSGDSDSSVSSTADSWSSRDSEYHLSPVLRRKRRAAGAPKKPSPQKRKAVPGGPWKYDSDDDVIMADPITLSPSQIQRRILKAQPPSKRWERLKAREEEKKKKLTFSDAMATSGRKSSLRSSDSKFHALYTMG